MLLITRYCYSGKNCHNRYHDHEFNKRKTTQSFVKNLRMHKDSNH